MLGSFELLCINIFQPYTQYTTYTTLHYILLKMFNLVCNLATLRRNLHKINNLTVACFQKRLQP